MENFRFKFRVWDKQKKRMYDVIEINFERFNNTLRYVRTNESKRLYEDFELMQYTGLKDKSGVEIYEGDIIYSKKYNVYSEKVVEEKGEVCFVNGSFTVNTKLLPDLCNNEVIGNIYENKELLK